MAYYFNCNNVIMLKRHIILFSLFYVSNNIVSPKAVDRIEYYEIDNKKRYKIS